jgi:alpha-1,6-mannosyltransferase
MLVGLRWLPFTPIIAYAAVFISSSLLYWVICRQSLHVNASAQGLLPLLLILVVVRATFIGMEPLGSDDVYRYVWDGRVQTAGINPYRFAPDDSALRSLNTEELPSLVNHPDMKTIYFPLCQWLFYLGYHLGGGHVWGFQFLLLVAEILTLIGLVMLMRELSFSPWLALIYAASPLAILQFSLDAHVDAFGFPLLIFAFLFYHRKKTNLSLLFFGLSLLIKPVAFVILPILFLREQGVLKKAKVILVPLAVLLIPFVPYALSANPFEALATFSEHWYFNGALFSALYPLFSDNQTTRLWCLVILAVALAALYWNKKPMHETAVLAVLLLLLCSPVAHLWYIGWLIVLLPLAPFSSGIALAATASLPSITFVTYQLNGVWKDYSLVLLLEYVPVIALLVLDLWKNRTSQSRTRQEAGDGPAAG